MEKFEIKKFRECDINDPFFDSLKNDYPGFVNWYNNHLDRDVYVNQNADGIRALLILKDDEQDEIKLKDNLLPQKPRIKICTLKLNENVRSQRLGEGSIGIALWHWQKRPEDEIYVTVFPKQEQLIALLLKFGFKDFGEFKNGEHLFMKSKKNIDKSTPYTMFPYLDFSTENFGILPVEDKYHDSLFPYSELKNSELFEGDMAVSNGISKIFIATPFTSTSYKEKEPIFIYRKFIGANPGYKSVITSYCTITKIHNIRLNNRYLKTKEEYLNIIKNKSVYKQEELDDIYANKSNIIIIEMVYNGYFGKGNNINWKYLKENGYWNDGHPYQIILSKEQFINLLKVGVDNEKDIIIN